MCLHTFGAEDPSDSPTGQPEPFREPIDNQNIVLVDVFNIFGGGDGRAVTVAGVIVPGVELVADQGGAAAAYGLDLGEFWIADHTSSRVAGIGR